MHNFDQLAAQLTPHYSYFKVGQRLLFTGHSHQAWPDAALAGQAEAFAVAAESVDEKWHTAFARTDVLRGYLRQWYDDPQRPVLPGGKYSHVIGKLALFAGFEKQAQNHYNRW